ncbi:hypothetical protein K2Z83_27460 [Oscillochloris sp. ZM17-4]|uniref:hypothetical protein n=1 Tax=Oscillochloris sp. ZM17-4 TaxID=2866714 RepID=UPI001C733EF3|nr:hypothetical protein [Oscillochloris sp. ZM17-4]MBX0331394.1 hypothetical protein [Oscillochloris sp. ZM17-4]
MNQQLAEWIYEGAVALTQGDKARALDLLMRVVTEDEEIPEAWLWLSGAVDDPDDQRTALENVIALDPENPHARQGLAILDGSA